MDKILTCSFCGKKQTEVDKIIQGHGVTICNECVIRCYSLLSNKQKSKVFKSSNVSVIELKKYIDQYIIGQEQAKKILCVSISNHIKRISHPVIDGIEIEKENVLLIGPSSSGKTALIKAISKKTKLPFVSCDATTFSEVGYVGSDPDTMLKNLIRASGGDVSLAEKGIIFIDEIDKKAKKYSSTKDASGEGVQYSLLKMIEGTIIDLEIPKKNGVEKVKIDTTNILFICAGAFSEIDKIIEKRNNKNFIGFNSRTDIEKNDSVTQEDIIEYGLIPELVGRLPIIARLNNLTKCEIRKVLTETKNSILKQYEKIFKIDDIDLIFDDSAIDFISDKTCNIETGIRGIRSYIEEKLIAVQFNIEYYKEQNVTTITLTQNFFEYDHEPILSFVESRDMK